MTTDEKVGVLAEIIRVILQNAVSENWYPGEAQKCLELIKISTDLEKKLDEIQ